MPDILHFPGARLDGLDHDHMFGPDRDGRYLAIKSHEYDANTNVSTLRLRAILPAEIGDWVRPLMANQRERERIRRVFNQ